MNIKHNLAGSMPRRQFIRASGVLVATAWASPAPAASRQARIGVTDWNLQKAANPSSLELAKRLGFDGVQISLGRKPDRLPLSERSLQDEFLGEAKRLQFPIASTCLDILHQNYLKSDPLAKRWVAESIPITQRLGAKVILLPFFGNAALKTHQEMDYVGDFLKEIAPEAKKAGVVFGIEDTISAEDNVRILDRAQSEAVRVYYDVGNSHNNGFDIYREIRWLGRDRICEIHLKDNPHLMGRGKIDFEKIVRAMADIGFAAWAVLETSAPSGSVEDDMKTNLGFIRQQFERA